MDTSKEFIQMCDCPEIQLITREKPRRDATGFIYAKEWAHEPMPCPKCETETRTKYCPECGARIGYEKREGYEIVLLDLVGPFFPGIWLPRQDQLQAMVETEAPGINRNRAFYLCQRLELFMYSQEDGRLLPYVLGFTSMEQLWLGFVMKKKYNKTWSGGEWVKAGLLQK